jgi:hypothetical protein
MGILASYADLFGLVGGPCTVLSYGSRGASLSTAQRIVNPAFFNLATPSPLQVAHGDTSQFYVVGAHCCSTMFILFPRRFHNDFVTATVEHGGNIFADITKPNSTKNLGGSHTITCEVFVNILEKAGIPLPVICIARVGHIYSIPLEVCPIDPQGDCLARCGKRFDVARCESDAWGRVACCHNSVSGMPSVYVDDKDHEFPSVKWMDFRFETIDDEEGVIFLSKGARSGARIYPLCSLLQVIV